MKTQKLLVITGPPGAGKNTIATAFSKSRKQCSVVDVDTVRQMVTQPHKAPWEGELGHTQQLLGVQNSCAIAINLLRRGYDVVILDVLSDETASQYRKILTEFQPKIVLLLPTYDAIKGRNRMRPQKLQDQEIEMLFRSQVALSDFDKKIDNSNLSVQETAELLV